MNSKGQMIVSIRIAQIQYQSRLLYSLALQFLTMSTCNLDKAFKVEKHTPKTKKKLHDHEDVPSMHPICPIPTEYLDTNKHMKPPKISKKKINNKNFDNYGLDSQETSEYSSKTAKTESNLKYKKSPLKSSTEKENKPGTHKLKQLIEIDPQQAAQAIQQKSPPHHQKRPKKDLKDSQPSETVLQSFKELRAEHIAEKKTLSKILSDKEMKRLEKIYETEEARMVLQVMREEQNK